MYLKYHEILFKMFSKLVGILIYYSIVNKLLIVICVFNKELLIFKQISEKDMGLLKERLKRASKNRVVPVATIQPTMKIVLPPVQHVTNVEEDIVDGEEYTSDCEENNAILNISQESYHEQNPQKNINNSPSSSANSSSYTSETIPTTIEHSLTPEMEFR